MHTQATKASTSAIADMLVNKAGEMMGKSPEHSDNQVEPAAEDSTLQTPAPVTPEGEENLAVPEGGESVADPEEQDAETEGVTLDDVAGMLDVPAKEIYGIQIPIGGGEVVSLGEMKDAFKRVQKFDDEKAEFAEHRRDQENMILTARRQTEDMIGMLVDSGRITPDDLQRLEQTNRARIAQENKRALAVIPSWKDQKVRERDFDLMVDFGSRYGFSDVEIRNIGDHRVLKVLYDAVAGERVKSEVKKTPPKPVGKPRANQAPKTLAQRKAEARRLGGATKRQLITDMISGRVPVE